ncbi:MAG TPA: TonB-dependent receptor [Candidatus Acidoferrales bacterium]|nr:TonB-dependent receptor [Candidatus Acidoferrales bacterium]
MKQLHRLVVPWLFLTVLLPATTFAGTTGKIAGTITDKTTSEALPGVNVLVMGTSLGASTDLNGQYTVLEVLPGTYKLQISMVGYKKVVVEDVVVHIDQTAHVDVALEPEAVQAGEVIVTAQQRLIKPDVATSVSSYTGNQAQQLPAVNIVSILGLQAGVQGGWEGPLGGASAPSYYTQNYTTGSVSVGGGISIRGGGGDQILFNVDGATLRDPRNNEPETRIAMSDVKEVSVERGGFNAEYGQVRSGIVNVVTREGSKSDYSGRFEVRLAPPQPKYWLAPGVYDINNPMSAALRPYFDPAVAWTGTTNGNWDAYTQQEYPSFSGWDKVAQTMNAEGYNLTPAECQRAFEYEIRKQQINNQPDYNIDAGFGGPVPVVSDALGGLRFFASYRSNRSMLVWPLSRPDYKDYDGTFQLNSDISPTMKLQLNGLYGETFTERNNWDTNLGAYFYPQSASDVAGIVGSNDGSFNPFLLYSNYAFCLTDIWHRNLSAKFTHTLNANTYYEVLLQNYTVHYNTRPAALRDTSAKVEVVPGFYEDSNPFGYWPDNNFANVIINGGSFYAMTRDHSFVSTTSLKADLTSQVNFENLVKAGIEFDYNDLHFDYGIINSQQGQNVYSSRTLLDVFPYRGAAYAQDKLETKEFTMNAGLRLDLSDANYHWWDINPFSTAGSIFFQPPDSATLANAKFGSTPSKMQLDLSPRLGISHPISENAKLFFNYGWFRELPQYETIFRVSRDENDKMAAYGNPNLILAKTVSYELGVDFSLGEEYLLQGAAYYNDVSDQQDAVQYVATSGVSYFATSANNYADNKGFEITLRKTTGDWVNGFVNYTYQVNTAGHFNEAKVTNNAQQQTIFDNTTENNYQNRPIPAPFARANVNFLSPADFGPDIIGNHIFGDWMLNIVVDWQAGYWTTWNPNNPNISYNVQAVDYFNTHLRLQKTLTFGRMNFQLFMDVDNVFNTLRLWDTGDENYLLSLHLPPSTAYANIPGSDRVGDYRKPGVNWQPMVEQNVDATSSPIMDPTQLNNGNSIAMYYNAVTGKYWWYGPHGYAASQEPGQDVNGWWQVPQSKVNQVVSDKAYIQMPKESTFWFLDPRTFYFGLTFSFNLSD